MTRTLFDQHARAHGLTRPQWRLLNALSFNPGVTQTQLADILEVEAITAGRQVDALEARGWVDRRNDPADRRVRRLYLTDEARPVLKVLGDASAQVDDVTFAGISDEDIDRLIVLLDVVRANLLTALDAERAGRGSSRRRHPGKEDVA